MSKPSAIAVSILITAAFLSALPSANAATPARHRAPDVVVGSFTTHHIAHVYVDGVNLKLGVAKEPAVVKAEGMRPSSVYLSKDDTGSLIVKKVTFRYGPKGSGCSHVYDFLPGGGAVVDFESDCLNTVSVTGARVGMSVQEAETVTGATFGEEGEFGSYDRCSFGNPGIVRKGNGGYVAVWAQEHDSENWNGPRTVESIAAYIPGSDYWNMVGCRKLH
jgi:hypothetical protein